MNKDSFVTKIRNLREKVADRGVFGAEEAVELIDTLLDSVDAPEEEKAPVVPPPATGDLQNQNAGASSGGVGDQKVG